MHRSLASRSALALLFAFALAGGAAAQQAPGAAPAAPCGGDLSAFLEGVKKDAVAAGASAAAADEAFAGADIDPKVLSRDRAQGVFKQTFLEFSQRTVSQARLDIGRQKMKQYADVFARAEQEFGVPRASSPPSGRWRLISAPSRVISTPATPW